MAEPDQHPTFVQVAVQTVVAAIVTAVAVHMLQILIMEDAIPVVTGGVSAAVAGLTASRYKKRPE